MVGLPAILEALVFGSAPGGGFFPQMHHTDLNDINKVFRSGASSHKCSVFPYDYLCVEAKLYRSITHEISARNYN